MEFEPISTTRMIALMVAGGLFACAGLYMMLRPRPEGAAKIELFGLKFESSSAGLLVFIVGAAFLSVTLFVPERASTGAAGPGNGAEQGVDGNGTGGGVLVPAIASSAETEPNDRVQEANQLQIGATVQGKVAKNAVDWYVIATDGQDGNKLVVKLRKVSGSQVGAELFDHREQRVSQIGWVSSGARVREHYVAGERAFLRVFGDYVRDGTTVYEVIATFEEP